MFLHSYHPWTWEKKNFSQSFISKHQIFSFENCRLDNIRRQVVKAKSLRDISKILGLGKRNSSPSECDWPKVKTQTSCDMAVNRHYLVSFHGEGITVNVTTLIFALLTQSCPTPTLLSPRKMIKKFVLKPVPSELSKLAS